MYMYTYTICTCTCRLKMFSFCPLSLSLSLSPSYLPLASLSHFLSTSLSLSLFPLENFMKTCITKHFFTSSFLFLPYTHTLPHSLYVLLPQQPSQTKSPRRRRSLRSVPLPPVDPRTRSLPSCKLTKTRPLRIHQQ